MANWEPTPEQRATIRRRLIDGDDLDTVATQCGAPRRAIQAHPDLGAYVSKRGRPPLVFSERERLKARQLAAAGCSHAKIARALDCSREALERHLGSDLASAASDRVALASAAIARALAEGDWRAGVRVLQAEERGSWIDSARVEVEHAPTGDATTEAIEDAITRMTADERVALRVVSEAFQRIAADGSVSRPSLTIGAARR